MGKVELLRDLGQKGSGHCSFEHKQCRSAIGTLAITIQNKCPAEIGPASGLQFHDGMPVPVYRGVPSVEKSATNLLIEYIGKLSRRRPEIGQNGNRIIVCKNRLEGSIRYQKAQGRSPGLKSPARVSCNSSTTLRLPMGCIDVADFQVLEVRLLCYGGNL